MKLRVDTDKDVNGASTIQTHISRFEAPYRVNGVFQTIQEISLPPDPLRRGEPYPNQIKSNQIKFNQTKTNQIKSIRIKSNQTKANQINSN